MTKTLTSSISEVFTKATGVVALTLRYTIHPEIIQRMYFYSIQFLTHHITKVGQAELSLESSLFQFELQLKTFVMHFNKCIFDNSGEQSS